MIYEFKSRATGTVIMTASVGDQMLKAIGKPPGPSGIITVDQMPSAIAALRKLLADVQTQESRGEPAVSGNEGDDEADDDADHQVSFNQRAWPLIKMLEEAHQAGKDITWGV